jgi:hypothetical protein
MLSTSLGYVRHDPPSGANLTTHHSWCTEHLLEDGILYGLARSDIVQLTLKHFRSRFMERLQ